MPGTVTVVGIVCAFPASFLAVVLGGNFGGAIGAAGGTVGTFLGISLGIFVVTLLGIVAPVLAAAYAVYLWRRQENHSAT